MSDRKALGLLVLIMTLSTLVVGALVFAALYQAALNRYRRDLVGAARAYAAATAALGEEDASSADLANGLPFLHRGLHETGRLLVGRVDRGQVVFIGTVAPPGGAEEADTAALVPLAELMRRALAGASGTARVSVPHRALLAAYEPVTGGASGVIATVDTEEVRAPFIDAAAKAAAAAVLVIGASAPRLKSVNAGRDDRDQGAICEEALADAHRPRPTRARAAEPRRQCPRRHAAGRHGDDHHQQ